MLWPPLTGSVSGQAPRKGHQSGCREQRSCPRRSGQSTPCKNHRQPSLKTAYRDPLIREASAFPSKIGLGSALSLWSVTQSCRNFAQFGFSCWHLTFLQGYSYRYWCFREVSSSLLTCRCFGWLIHHLRCRHCHPYHRSRSSLSLIFCFDVAADSNQFDLQLQATRCRRRSSRQGLRLVPVFADSVRLCTPSGLSSSKWAALLHLLPGRWHLLRLPISIWRVLGSEAQSTSFFLPLSFHRHPSTAWYFRGVLQYTYCSQSPIWAGLSNFCSGNVSESTDFRLRFRLPGRTLRAWTHAYQFPARYSKGSLFSHVRASTSRVPAGCWRTWCSLEGWLLLSPTRQTTLATIPNRNRRWWNGAAKSAGWESGTAISHCRSVSATHWDHDGWSTQRARSRPCLGSADACACVLGVD